MSEMEITREDVAGRARAGKLAPQDPARALAAARAIKHPWYRCQALSMVAEHLSGQERERALLSALAAAREQDQVNRIVTVSAWPVRGLADAGSDSVGRQVEELVALAQTEPHHLRRSHALQALAFAVAEHPQLLGRVVPALAAGLLGGHGPRMDRCIRDTFGLILRTRPELAWELAMHHKANRRQSLLLAQIPQ
ncbi:hypothetical protein ABU614_21395 [Lysobacter firmicutimachus]|uniref:HEAT repeat domain-containing protein n=1 Tax=Lysobacter firmicutimachus TaxID=1792846 RepID=A0AAU8MUR1_9GAMM